MIHPAGVRRKILAMVVLLAGAVGARPVYGDPIFQEGVTVDGTLVGTFTVDTYEEFSVVGTSFGIAIQGGFNPSSYALPPGYEYRWIQTVATTLPAYSWQSPGGTYVDRTRVDDGSGEFILARSHTPFYNDGIVTPDGLYELPFADNPSRVEGPTAFHGTWSLSLVAVQARTDLGDFNQPEPGVTRAIYQLATFVWGFDLDAQLRAVPRTPIVQVAPDPLALAQILADDPDVATFGNNAWNIRAGLPSSPGVIPEPSSYLLAASALVAVGVPTALRRCRPRAA